MMRTTDPQGTLHAAPGSVERNGKPRRVAVYCRVSSDEQAQAGTIENSSTSPVATATSTGCWSTTSTPMRG